MRKLGIAIVGTGMIGAVHRRAALLAGADVRGVVAAARRGSGALMECSARLS